MLNKLEIIVLSFLIGAILFTIEQKLFSDIIERIKTNHKDFYEQNSNWLVKGLRTPKKEKFYFNHELSEDRFIKNRKLMCRIVFALAAILAVTFFFIW